jgi:hypothetical protein
MAAAPASGCAAVGVADAAVAPMLVSPAVDAIVTAATASSRILRLNILISRWLSSAPGRPASAGNALSPRRSRVREELRGMHSFCGLCHFVAPGLYGT